MKFYMAMLGSLAAHPQIGVIENFAEPSCEACTRQAESIAALVKDHAHIEPVDRRSSDYAIRADSTDDSVIVTLHLTDGGNVKVTADGNRETLPKNNLRAAARADWTNGQWKFGEAGVDKK